MHVRVMCREILYADYHNHYVQIHTDSDIIRSKMYFDELETMLKDPRFLYCNRNCMVNMDRIKGVEKLGFLMENGEYVPIKKLITGQYGRHMQTTCLKKWPGLIMDD